MVKPTPRIRRQQPTNCLSVLDHFWGLPLKGLRLLKMLWNCDLIKTGIPYECVREICWCFQSKCQGKPLRLLFVLNQSEMIRCGDMYKQLFRQALKITLREIWENYQTNVRTSMVVSIFSELANLSCQFYS